MRKYSHHFGMVYKWSEKGTKVSTFWLKMKTTTSCKISDSINGNKRKRVYNGSWGKSRFFYKGRKKTLKQVNSKECDRMELSQKNLPRFLESLAYQVIANRNPNEIQQLDSMFKPKSS
ncbi:hypothetical protein BDEG_23118 [Batrachochytrium dendrobatidis JEL423]|uniref:Uncharacterized protein n=1 Tax=Batrachochytrium dendrobatidis (strain JEL423) TaxID=403673 RepID=A0A177WHK1_BATDL|nr:hypothetical protein BDEG_23118 [Batrachochytrium dendrobatidis JEL423]